MFKTIDEACQFVMNRRNESKGFEQFKQFMNSIGNPQNKLKVIHIAGTNGKGSVTNYTCDLLMEAGYTVGMFVSPHLIKHQDRIQINHQNIPDDQFIYYLNKWYKSIIDNQLNMFQIDYLIMCDYFTEFKVDYAVIETGLGGRLDSTNVIDHPLVSVIVTIGYDHQERLGNSLAEIAFEKAGIIKPNGIVICGKIEHEAMTVIKKQVMDKQSQLYVLDPIESMAPRQFRFENENYVIRSQAYYQIDNAALALKIATVLIKHYGLIISKDQMHQALEKSLWSGRFENIKDNIYIDGAHNIDGIKALIASFETIERPIHTIVSILKDKDYNEMLQLLREASDEVYFASFDFYRAFKPNEIYLLEGIIPVENYLEAIASLSKNQKGSIVICGSLYFISEIIEKVQ